MKSYGSLFFSTLALLAAGAAPALAQPVDPIPATITDDELPFLERNGTRIPLFAHEGTFTSANTGWGRRATEIEAAYTVDCIDGSRLHTMITRRGSNFRRVRRAATRPMEAFSVGYPINQMPWGSTAHDIREGRIPGSDAQRIIPYVWVKIESDKFEVDPDDDGRRRLNLGTDTMDDTIYDSDDYLLLAEKFVVRARLRWDSDTEMRRLLIALKMDRGIDPFGIKRAAKTDQRDDTPTLAEWSRHDELVARGLKWDERPASALRRAYLHLRDRNKLKSSPTYKNVLALKPKAFIRSIRSRYHLNENSVSEINAAYELGKTRLQALVNASRETRTQAPDSLTTAQASALQAFEAKVRGVLDGSLVAERAASKLTALGMTGTIDVAAITSLMPGSTNLGRGTSLEDIAARKPLLEQRKVVADTISDLYHELTRDLDDGSSESLRRALTRSLDPNLRGHGSWFRDWQYDTVSDTRRHRTYEAFLEIHADMADDNAQRRAYNAYGEQQRASSSDPESEWFTFRPLTTAAWKDLRFQLRNEQARIWMRQIESAGSAAKGLWFDQARQFYVPRSRRVTGNFMIDTFDYAAMFSPDVWEAGPTPVAPADRNPAFDLNRAPYSEKILHSTLVNEVQIELTVSDMYTNRLKELRSLIALPRYFMLWATATNQGMTPAEYTALFEELKALSDDELNARLAEFNDFLDHDGSAPINQIEAEQFRDWLDPARLTAEVRDDANYTEPAIKAALDGATFVFEQYRNMMQFAAELKGPSTIERLRTNRFNGPACMTWVPASDSKGAAALRHAKAVDDTQPVTPTPPPGGGGIGIIGALEGNNSKATAFELTRPSKLDNLKIADTGTGNDPESDFYKFTLKANETIRFQLTFSHADGDLDVQLRAEDGTRLRREQSSSDNESLSYTNETNGDQTVYLRVYGYDGATNGYSLETE